MTTSLKPMGNKRALLIAIRSVVGPEFSDLPYLSLAHQDARDLRSQLTDSYGYNPDDITLMIDRKEHPRELWPTHKNILNQIDRLTRDVPEGCHFFFYFSGHGLEEACSEPDRASMRADGMEEEIVCADGKPILDDILHNRLITPLEMVNGAKLFALFDCCHSETLLDLRRGVGPNHYSRRWDIGRDQFFRDVVNKVIKILHILRSFKKLHHRDCPRRKSTNRGMLGSDPTSVVQDIGELSVICLSACGDKESALDDRDGQLTFTRCFMEAMAQNPNMSWTDLRDALHKLVCKIRARYEDACACTDDGTISECQTQEPRILAGSHTDLRQPVWQMIR